MSADLDRYERHLIDAIAGERLRYEAAVRPFVEELVRIRSMRPPPPIIVDTSVLPQLFPGANASDASTE